MIKEPVVSIICLTYNHGILLIDALKGFLAQETDFEYEILVFDDCSSDNTVVLFETFYENCTDEEKSIIRYFRNDVNVGMQKNGYNALLKAKGEFIALCEGDDYWINKYKLQQQIDFLTNNANFSGCCHNLIINEDGRLTEKSYSNLEFLTDFSIEDLIQSGISCPIGTASLCFRRSLLISELEKFYVNLPFGDRVIEILLLKHGPIRFFPQNHAVYRKHNNGFTSYFDWQRFLHDYVLFYEYVNQKTLFRYSTQINRQLASLCLESFNQAYRFDDYELGKKSLLLYIKYGRMRDFFNVKFIKGLLKLIILKIV